MHNGLIINCHVSYSFAAAILQIAPDSTLTDYNNIVIDIYADTDEKQKLLSAITAEALRDKRELETFKNKLIN